MHTETMTHPAYPAARAAALRIHPHFILHDLQTRPDMVPDTDTIEAVIDAAFWASLRREEGVTPRISLAFVRPEHVVGALTFERPLPLASPVLTRLAPAVERPGIHLGIWRERGELKVWGTTRNVPTFCFVLEVLAPGLLVIKHSRGEDSGKFVNVAVLEGDQIKVIDQGAASLPDCPDLLTTLLGLESKMESEDSVNILIQIAVSMRNHHRGGSLLVVPNHSSEWRHSILQPITYSVVPSFSAFSDLLQEEPVERAHRRWQEALHGAVERLAGLTAVDGATVITDEYQLLGFGAKIVRRPGSSQIDRVVVTEPVEGSAPEILEPSQIGGTRHLSAAQFAHDQRDAIALVASQDGRFTVFGWSPCEGMVHTHRIETLLL